MLAIALVAFAAVGARRPRRVRRRAGVGSLALLAALVGLRCAVRRGRRSDQPAPAGRRHRRDRRWRGRPSRSSAASTRTGSPTPASRCCSSAGAFWALHHWLRAHREPGRLVRRPTAPARAGSSTGYGRDSLSFFSLRADRRYCFSRGGNAFLAYRVVAGCALVAGDPIGAADEIPGLVEDFGGAVPRARLADGRAAHAPSRVARPVPPPRHARGRDRRRGRAAPGDVLARGPQRAQGAPVGHAPAQGRLRGAGRRARPSLRRRCGPISIGSRASGAAALGRARVLDGDGRSVRPRPGPVRRSPSTPTGGCAASCTWCRRAAATRSRRCAAAPTRRTA